MPTLPVNLNLNVHANNLLQSGLASARGSLTGFGRFAEGVGERARAALSKAFSFATGPVGMALGAFGVGGGIIGAGLGGRRLIESLVGPAAEWEGYLQKLTVALKDPAKAMQEFAWAKQFAASTPFEMGEVVDAATRLRMYGMDARKWLPLVGDMAGSMGRSVTDAVEAVSDALQGGGLERLKEFGIGSLQLQKAGWTGKYGTAEGAATLRTALESILSTRFGGGMEKYMVTLTGKVSNLKDAWTQLREQAGEPILGVLKGIVSETTAWVNSLVQAGVGLRVGDKIARGILWAFEKAKELGEWVGTRWREHGESWTKTALDWVAKVVHGGAQLLVWAADFRAALEAAFAHLSFLWKKFQLDARPVVEWLGEVFGSLMDYLGQRIGKLIETLKGVKLMGTPILTGVGEVVKKLMGPAQPWVVPEFRRDYTKRERGELQNMIDQREAALVGAELTRRRAWQSIAESEGTFRRWLYREAGQGAAEQQMAEPTYRPLTAAGTHGLGGAVPMALGEWYYRTQVPRIEGVLRYEGSDRATLDARYKQGYPSGGLAPAYSP